MKNEQQQTLVERINDFVNSKKQAIQELMQEGIIKAQNGVEAVAELIYLAKNQSKYNLYAGDAERFGIINREYERHPYDDQPKVENVLTEEQLRGTTLDPNFVRYAANPTLGDLTQAISNMVEEQQIEDRFQQLIKELGLELPLSYISNNSNNYLGEGRAMEMDYAIPNRHQEQWNQAEPTPQ